METEERRFFDDSRSPFASQRGMGITMHAPGGVGWPRGGGASLNGDASSRPRRRRRRSDDGALRFLKRERGEEMEA